uniref:Methyltransferase type 11 domain-containing protein n=1 Tax=Salix viminalis TaxID=40686 RepID=A0A6N2KA76_SALVM
MVLFMCPSAASLPAALPFVHEVIGVKFGRHYKVGSLLEFLRMFGHRPASVEHRSLWNYNLGYGWENAGESAFVDQAEAIISCMLGDHRSALKLLIATVIYCFLFLRWLIIEEEEEEEAHDTSSIKDTMSVLKNWDHLQLPRGGKTMKLVNWSLIFLHIPCDCGLQIGCETLSLLLRDDVVFSHRNFLFHFAAVGAIALTSKQKPNVSHNTNSNLSESLKNLPHTKHRQNFETSPLSPPLPRPTKLQNPTLQNSPPPQNHRTTARHITSKSGGGLRIRPGYSSYDEYIQRQLNKTLNPKLRKIWTTRDWQRIVDRARVGQEVSALKSIGVNDSIGIDLVPYPPLVVKGDFHAQPFMNDTFDFEFSNVFDHALYPWKFVGEIERTLKPGGVCVIHVALSRRADKYSANDLYSVGPLVELFKGLQGGGG